MESILAAVLAMIILAPMIFFLPLGFSLKGKMAILLISYLLANVGLMANETYSLWQTSLILLFVLILTSIVIDSRMGRAIYSQGKTRAKEYTDIKLVEEELFEVEIVEDNEQEKGIEKESMDVTEEEAQERIELNQSDEFNFEVEELDTNLHVAEENVYPTSEVSLDKVEEDTMNEIPTNLPIKDSENPLEEFDDDDISFLNNREELIVHSTIDNEKQDDVVETSYMSEIERLLQDDTELHVDTEVLAIEDPFLEPSKIHEEEMAVSIDNDDEEELPVLTFETDNKVIEETPRKMIDWEKDEIEPIKEFKKNH